MSVGVKLATDVYLPSKQGAFPVILVRTPYGKVNMMPLGQVRRGYALVAQDMRGRFESEGENLPFPSFPGRQTFSARVFDNDSDRSVYRSRSTTARSSPATITADWIVFVPNRLNTRPRKCLDFKPPDVVYFLSLIHI